MVERGSRGGRRWTGPIAWALGALVVIAMVSQPARAAGPDISGRWETNFGPVIVGWDDAVGAYVGRYFYQNLKAVMSGPVDDDSIWEGIWIQQTSEVVCAETRAGSPYWGRFRLAMSDGRWRGL